MQNVVDFAFDFQRIGDVVSDERESGIVAELVEVRERAGDEIIDADNFVAFFEKSFAKVGTNETTATGNQSTHQDSFM
jgi:hypothetical protein